MSDGKKMKAFVLQKASEIAWETREIPQPGPGEALVKTRMVGICGSDIHAYRGLQPSMVFPGILGHEILGEVISVNGEQGRAKPGDRVVVDPSIACGHCYPCSIGRFNICEDLQVLGVHKDGAYSEYFLACHNQLYRVPDRIADEEAVLAEPLSIAAQTIDRGQISKKDKVLLIGAGPIGLATLALLKEIKASTMVVDLLPARLEAAQKLGADVIIDGGLEEKEILIAVRAFAGKSGPQVVIDAAGVQDTINMAVTSVSRAGRIVILGMSPPDVMLSSLQIMKKELDVIGTRMANSKFPEVLQYLSDPDKSKLLREQMVSRIFPYEEMEDAFFLVEKAPHEVVKVLVDFR